MSDQIDRRLVLTVAAAVAAWAALIATATLRANPMRKLIKLEAPPLIGAVDPDLWPGVPLMVILGAALVIWVPRFCARLGWRRLLLVMTLVALGWGTALALGRGADRLTLGLDGPYEYPVAVAQADELGVGRFVETFSDPEVLENYPIHVEGHPVGATLVFVALDRVGLPGPGGAAWLMILVGASTVPAVMLAAREVAGEDRARQAAPFLAIGPAAIWAVTSADAMFMGVAAWAISLIVLATGSSRPARDLRLLALGGGLLFGLGIHLSYGMAPLILIPVIVATVRKQWQVLLFAAVGGGLVTGVFVAFGFWWFDGLAATRVRYEIGVARRRPFRYFALLGNPAAFAVACGPAVAVMLAKVRDRGLWLLSIGGVIAVCVADLSGLSKGEIERIWLPFVPWVMVLCGGLARHGRALATSSGTMRWSTVASVALALQVVAAIVVEFVIRTPW